MVETGKQSKAQSQGNLLVPGFELVDGAPRPVDDELPLEGLMDGPDEEPGGAVPVPIPELVPPRPVVVPAPVAEGRVELEGLIAGFMLVPLVAVRDDPPRPAPPRAGMAAPCIWLVSKPAPLMAFVPASVCVLARPEPEPVRCSRMTLCNGGGEVSQAQLASRTVSARIPIKRFIFLAFVESNLNIRNLPIPERLAMG